MERASEHDASELYRKANDGVDESTTSRRSGSVGKLVPAEKNSKCSVLNVGHQTVNDWQAVFKHQNSHI